MQKLVRNKRGVQSDKILLGIVSKNPGLSQYELTKLLDWPSGKVDGAIRRLLNENQIVIKSTQRNGRQVNLIYPKDSKPSDLIEVPTNLLNVENGQWQEHAFIYALDSTTIGIAGAEIPEWKEYDSFTATTPLKKRDETIELQIPQKFAAFYSIERKHKVVTLNGNTLIITITGNLIEEKKYPA
jgi:hypothetical protein